MSVGASLSDRHFRNRKMTEHQFAPDSPEVGVFMLMLGRQTVQVAPAPGDYPLGFEIPLGSGVLLSSGGKNYVLTVRHIFESLAPEKFVVNFADRDVKIIDQKEYERAVALRSGRPGEYGNVLGALFPKQPTLDLALLKIGKLPPWCTSVQLDKEKLEDVRRGQGVMAFGIPRDAGTTIRKPNAAFHHARTFAVGGDVVAPGRLEDWTEGFMPRRHFAMRYDRSQDPSRAFDPEGMSGCGVWRLTQGPGGAFMPRVLLAGIQESYFGDRRALKVVRASAVKKFLAEVGVL